MPPEMRKWLVLSVAIIVCDQASKALLTAFFRLGEVLTLTSFFDLVFVFNRGAAFSFLAHADGWQRWFFVALALGISVWIFFELKRHARATVMACGFSLVMGGALGNVIDRLTYGAVVDFLSFHAGKYYWPAFNVADSAITVGVALLLWQQFRQGKNS